jgi:hypothetical protein
MAAHLTSEQRQLVFRLRHRGLTTAAIAKEIGLTWEGAAAVLRGQKCEARPNTWPSAPGRLSVPEREEKWDRNSSQRQEPFRQLRSKGSLLRARHLVRRRASRC